MNIEESIFEEINDDFFKNMISSVSVGYQIPPQVVKKWKMGDIVESHKTLIWKSVGEEKELEKAKKNG